MAEGRVTYQEIKEALAEKLDISITSSDELFKDLIYMIQLGLERDEQVYIPKFGTFELHDVAAREGINPQTGEGLVIPAHKKVVFKPRKALRTKVNTFKHLHSYPVEDRSKPVKRTTSPWIWGVLGILLMIGGIAYYETQRDTSYLNAIPKEASTSDTSAIQMAMISKNTRVVDVTAYNLYNMEGKNHLYNLSRELYGDPKFWPLLYFANYNALHNPDRLPVLKKMKIYTVNKGIDTMNTKDRKMMSLAYGLVARSYYYSGKYGRYSEYKKRANEFYQFN